MAMRISGMYSGMDTETIIADLVAVRQKKVDVIKKAQTKHEWKQEAWKTLNSKVYKLFNNTLENLTYQTSYAKKTTKVSNPNAATVITGDNAMKSVQSLKIKRLASSGYMTGAELKAGTTKDTTLRELLGKNADGTDIWGANGDATIKLTLGSTTEELTLSADSKISDVTKMLQDKGLNVNFDTATNRIFIGAAGAGEKNDFDLSVAEGDTFSGSVLTALGLSANAVKEDGTDAEIELNGATFKSSSNTFEINGLTITCNAVTGNDTITLTTQDDTSGVYDMIKSFIKEYTSLINEMDKLYNTKAKKGLEPLTDEEKEAVSETEAEKIENSIKDAILQGDSTLSAVSSAMKEVMRSGFEVNGETLYLFDFGIETMGYTEAAANEKNAYYINGDEDNENSAIKNKTNDLMAAISKNPTQVRDFFVKLSQSLKAKLNDLMRGTEYSSAYTVYEDKKMQEEYADYTKKIKEEEKRLADYEDKWYKKFGAMETAMAKMQSNMNAVSNLFGGM